MVFFSFKFKKKKVISFGLYGAAPKYTFGALRNVELAKIFYPGWVCRFYSDKSVPQPVIDRLKEEGAEVVLVDTLGLGGGIGGMFWRFLVADDPTVGSFFYI
jgi:hypothetical protein